MASKKKRSSRSSRRSRHGNAQQRRAPDRITALARETGLRTATIVEEALTWIASHGESGEFKTHLHRVAEAIEGGRREA